MTPSPGSNGRSPRALPDSGRGATGIRHAGRARLGTLLGIAGALIALAWALRGIDPGELLRAASLARPLPVAGCLLAGFLSFRLRAGRLRRLTGTRGSSEPFFRASAIGNLANVLLPARAGELVRCWMLSRRLETSFAANLAFTLLDRLLDVAVFAATLIVSGIWIAGELPGGVSAWAALPALLGTVAVMALAVPLLPRAVFDRVLRIAARLRPRRLAFFLVTTGRTLLGAVDHVKGTLLVCLSAETAAIVAVDLAGFWLLVHSLAPGLPLVWVVYLGVALVMGLALPGPPAGLGLHQAIAVVVLGWRGVPRETALVISILAQGLTLLLTAALGGWSLFREGTSLRRVLEGARRDSDGSSGDEESDSPPFRRAGRTDDPTGENRPPSQLR